MNPNRFAVLFWLAATALAQAHPGHSTLDYGASHLLTSPAHLITLVLAGIVSVGAARLVRSARIRTLLKTMGTLCIVAAAATVFSR